MSFFGFKGGIHPEYNKELSKNSPIERLTQEVGDKVFIALSQHIGAPAQEIVKKKQQVKTGEKIATAAGFISADIHSSVTGTVEGVVNIPHPISGKVQAIKISVDEISDDYEKIDNSLKFQTVIKEAGIVGMGGATFPTNVKLSPPKKIDYLIINGAECEPYLTCDHRLMVERTEDILKGGKLIIDNLKIEKFIVGIEKNKPDAIKLFKNLTDKYNFELVELDVKYPQGGEKQLIKATINKVVPEGKLPLESGVIVQNVGTCIAIYEAVELAKPLYERVVTVTGAVKNPKNLFVKIGTPISKLIEECGGFVGTPKKIIMGGPMMGFAVTSLETTVMKGTSGLVVLREEDLPDLKEYNCIRCGRCINACPMGLIPVNMEQFSLNEMYESLLDWHVLNCIECGCCSYVCPSRRPLVGYFKTAKREVMKIIRQREQDARK
jgi:electron transport complex protein RnfC